MPPRGRKPITRKQTLKQTKLVDSVVPSSSPRHKRSRKSDTDSVCSTPKCTPKKIATKRKANNSETESEYNTPKSKKTKHRITVVDSPKSPEPPTSPEHSHDTSHPPLPSLTKHRGSVLPAGHARLSVPHHLSSHKRPKHHQEIYSDSKDEDYVPSNCSSSSNESHSASDCEVTMVSKAADPVQEGPDSDSALQLPTDDSSSKKVCKGKMPAKKKLILSPRSFATLSDSELDDEGVNAHLPDLQHVPKKSKAHNAASTSRNPTKKLLRTPSPKKPLTPYKKLTDKVRDYEVVSATESLESPQGKNSNEYFYYYFLHYFLQS